MEAHKDVPGNDLEWQKKVQKSRSNDSALADWSCHGLPGRLPGTWPDYSSFLQALRSLKLWSYESFLIHTGSFILVIQIRLLCVCFPFSSSGTYGTCDFEEASAGGIVSRRAATTASHVHFPKQSCCLWLRASLDVLLLFVSSSLTSCLFHSQKHFISLEVAVETKLRRQEWRAASAASILCSITIMWNCAKVGNLGLRAQNTKTEGQWQVLAWPFCWGLSSSFSRLVMGRSQKTSAIFWTRCRGMTRICADWWAIGFLLYLPPQPPSCWLGKAPEAVYAIGFGIAWASHLEILAAHSLVLKRTISL